MSGRKYHILFLSGWYPNRTAPTLGNFVEKHAESAALYNTVSALHVTSDKNCTGTSEIVQTEKQGVLTVIVYYKKVESKLPIVSHAIKLQRYMKAHELGLQRIIEQRGMPDLIHQNVLYPSGLVAWLWKKKLGLPYIITEHSTDWLPEKAAQARGNQRLKRMIASGAALITTVSEDLRDAMKNAGINNEFEVVNNVADTALFFPPIQQPNRPFRFLHISTLDDRHKNISGMLRAVKKLSEKRKDFQALFLGDGDTTPHIRYAAELGILNTFAIFDGAKTTAEVAAMMREADCFLMFSNYENFPCVIVESFASGIPVIASDVGGISEHVKEGKGFLVAAQDEQELVKKMEIMIGGPQLETAHKLHEYARSEFSFEAVGKKFQTIYNRIISNSL
jgi:glycosyltransferase involved in cell wall biosynthesis